MMFAAQAALVMANSRRFRDEQRARADLEALIETSPMGVMVLERQPPVSRCPSTGRPGGSSATWDRTTSSLEELLGMLTIRRADGSEISLGELTLAQAMQAGETVRAEEINISIPERPVGACPGERHPHPLRQSGDVETFIVTLQDMAPLEELERLRAEFLGVVSHELRAPLSSIKGSVATLLGESDKMDPVEMRQFFRLIDQQADRMRELIGNLMDVVRIETGSMPVSPEPEEVARLVELARESFLQGGGRRNLQIQLGPNLPRVLADRRRVTQVLENLLTNAERFSPEWSIITIGAAVDGSPRGDFRFRPGAGSVRRGPAQPVPQVHARWTGRRPAGSLPSPAWGCPSARGSWRLTGAASGPRARDLGLGMTITLTLPAAEEIVNRVRPVPRWSGNRPGPGTAGSQCILAVDDDPEALRYVRDTLTEAGFSPSSPHYPEEAFRLIEA